MNFNNHFLTLNPAFYHCQLPKPLNHAQMMVFNSTLAQQLSKETFSEQQWLELCSGQALPPGAEPLAMKYGGHQFGGWNPELGDGRGLLLGQIIATDDQSYDLHLKGAGQTPYSRHADGRAVLRSSIREFLCSEAMHGLGIATTRALAVTNSQSHVFRETAETGAMLLRVANSHIRFGHFEYFSFNQQHDLLKELLDYTIKQHFPEVTADDYHGFFSAVVSRTAKLIAQWQAQGFCHGVMNTDNMSIIGDTFDYGPFAFLDDYQPGYICNHSDYQGRYAFDRQPAIGMWNLQCLAAAISPLCEPEQLKAALEQYETHLRKHYLQLITHKLGLNINTPEIAPLISGLLNIFTEQKIDYHFFFRKLTLWVEQDLPEAKQASLTLDLENPATLQWLDDYRRAMLEHAIDGTHTTAAAVMAQKNPIYVLRNWYCQQAIEAAEAGDFSVVQQLFEAVSRPFEVRAELSHFSMPPPQQGKHMEISCSS
ncbi:protein adenylyltransferase SelO [Pelagibaculum spongiae]|uniref:Protein nucleotidyltransferase YdiU n=1 Tax=Pelagibaculum spongiae TaxID=2080658 RepID=A0A2V1GP11_9GAMM|nr:YdiU family protein [Pelagibaculum spongiae]PVZ64382.1 YdiU family protein [Pelagibaculum spongiae]